DRHRSLSSIWRAFINPLPKGAGPQQSMAGSNWLSATTCRVDFWDENSSASDRTGHVKGYLDTVGVRRDGTLWISEKSAPQIWAGNKMIQYGTDTNWRQVIRYAAAVRLLKSDGTLWEWSSHIPSEQWQTNWPDLRNYAPQHITTKSNWTEIFSVL